MKKREKHNFTKAYLEERVNYLENVERFTVDALELAASLGDFQNSINKLRDTSTILAETSRRIRRLLPLSATAFFLVEEGVNDFHLRHIHPEEMKGYLQTEVDHCIEDGIFAWALHEKRPVVISATDHKKLLLHVMATSSRVRGMFVGLLSAEDQHIQNVSLSLLSIVLLNSANAIESFELYKTIREIRSNLERIDNYRVLFEAAPDGVEVLDASGCILDVNQCQGKMLGYPKEHFLGTQTFDYFSEKGKGALAQQHASLKENGYWEGEIELIAANGTKIPVWRKESAILDQKRRYIGTVVYNRDISIRKRAEEEKKALEARLTRAEKMEALGFLAGGVAHDLNNILGGLVSYPELILMQLPKDSPMRKSIMTIQKSGEKAAAIVEDLLTLARRGVYEPQVLNLNDVVLDYLKTPEHERLKSFHPSFRLSLELDPDLLKIKGSPVHLSKVMMNLMSNAVEAVTESGEVHIRTEYRYLDGPVKGYDVVEEGDYVVLTVRDNGKGIAPGDIDKIFEPFYTKKNMGRSGTGLGLAVVWGTVKDHNGYIDVQSEAGKGTTFTIYFPVTQEIARDRMQPVEMAHLTGNGESILVVDDVYEQRDIATGLLSRLGYAVSDVSNGLDAVDFIASRPVDLVLLDMIMDPGIDGLETYRRILDVRPGQKAIIVSGYSETERVKKAQQLGAGAYVRKPYRMETLGAAVRDALAK